MSRIGKLPIQIPAGVKVRQDGQSLLIEGPRGKENHQLPSCVTLEMSGDTVSLRRADEGRATRALHGLTRKLVANMVTGVSKGFVRTLEIVGVGYRAEAKGNQLHMNLGYSHPIVFDLPAGVTAKVDKQTIVTLEANNRQVLGQVAAQIRELRPPEPYKGKGIKYSDEVLRRKAGKAAGAGSK